MPAFLSRLRVPELPNPNPGITTWQRLESDPTALDLAPGLEARIADPLWLLGRQWQLGELRGEDAGTPIRTHFVGVSSPVVLRDGHQRPEDAADAVWEPEVEAEHEPISAYPALAAEAGIDFQRCLTAAGAQGMIDLVRQAFPLDLRDPDASTDRRSALQLELLRGSAIDGKALLAECLLHTDADGVVTELPPQIAALGPLLLVALQAATAWVAEWKDMFVAPITPPAWRDRRLEYSFDLDTGEPDQTSLHVEEYADGRLDWWSLDVGATPSRIAATTRQIEGTRIPTPVRYPGMPADRYFEFEDGSVNFAGVTGGSTSISAMLVLEYVLASSNDWFHLPLTLNYGHTFDIQSFTVTDTFGYATEVQRAGDAAGGWSMFDLSLSTIPAHSSHAFVLPAVAAQTLEGDPIEEVALFRDEMANLVWAVERIVPGVGAIGISPRSQGQVLHQAANVVGLTDAAYIYRLQTPVPMSWHPLAAISDPHAPLGAVLFELRTLPRTIRRSSGDVVVDDGRPRGRLLSGDDGGFLVEENEVPRAGVALTRSFQMTRTPGGERLLWLGRTKRVGRGEGSSGLRYDVTRPVD